MRPTTRDVFLVLVMATSLALAPTALASAGAPGPETGATAATIYVRGHWVFEVRDPDGTPVATHEFLNALTTVGQATLAGLVVGSVSAGPFEIVLPEGNSPCAPRCVITEPRTTLPASPTRSKNLTKTVTGNALTLSGSIVMPSSGDVIRVQTGVPVCAATVSPASCLGSGLPGTFTSTDLPTRVAVVAGQTVLVTVTLSFGSGSGAPLPASR
jgi:hypothetical protein